MSGAVDYHHQAIQEEELNARCDNPLNASGT
jgi:hypothetical protein